MSEENIFASNRMTNDDFRQLLKTPRASVPAATPLASVPGTVRDASAKTAQTPAVSGSNRAELRRKKKSVYAKLKKQEDDKMAELAEKYRDRARERRVGINQDAVEDPMTNVRAYRAVAPDLKSSLNAVERRRQMIQQSKFLGGDMEHTHLVKGLDYALLQKVRSEIEAKKYEEIKAVKIVQRKEKVKENKEPEKKDEEITFKTKMGRNIYKTLMAIESKTVERCEIFTPGRMAYVFNLDDENAEADIPTTLIRSKADVPTIDSTTRLTTNDIIINKLTQIFSYIRQGKRNGKKEKKNKDIRSRPEDFKELELAPTQLQDDSIYGDIGDYVPTLSKSDSSQKKKEKDSYFEKPLTEFGVKDNAPRLPSSSVAKVAAISDAMQQEDTYFLVNPAAEPEGYAECYVGMDEMQDAIDDSDDESDCIIMDRGNKKGPIDRRDTPEEYDECKNNTEALPKTAFQCGVQMVNGRRTGKYNKEKTEKAKLDREWQGIQQILNKRKSAFGDGGRAFKVLRC